MTECKDVLTIKRYCSWDIAAYENLRVLRYLGIAERIVQKPFGSIYLGDEKARQWCWEYLAIFQGKHQVLCLFAVDGKKRNRPCALRINPWPAELADRAEFDHRCASILNGDEGITRDKLINEELKCCRGHVAEHITDSNIRKQFMCFWYLHELSDDDMSQLKALGKWLDGELIYSPGSGSISWTDSDGKKTEDVFSENQRIVFNRLYECHSDGLPGLHTNYLLQGTEADRLKDLFGGSPFYNTLIQKHPSKRGVWRLNP